MHQHQQGQSNGPSEAVAHPPDNSTHQVHVEGVHWDLQHGQPQQLGGRGPADNGANGDHGGGRSEGGVDDERHVELDAAAGVLVREDLRRGVMRLCGSDLEIDTMTLRLRLGRIARALFETQVRSCMPLRSTTCHVWHQKGCSMRPMGY
jgi:hypothetical protein